MDIPDLTTYSYEAGKRLLEKRQPKTLKESGQFLTPPAIARYMAIQLGKIPERATILEPAIGSGVLACAVIEELIANNYSTELWLVAYETDPGLCDLCREVLAQACQKAEKSGIRIHWQVHQEDFILACLPDPQPSLFNNTHKRREFYDYIISNPPYFKLYKEDKRVKAVSGKVKGHTNIYTLFMALSAKMLTSTGRACFIVPRSFCSGAYFSEFRRDFLRDAAPLAVHLFQSRDDIFRSEEVLQENVIFTFGKASQPKSRQYLAGLVKISSSKDYNSLQNIQIKRDVTFEQFLSKRGKHLFFRLPTGVLDEQILDAVDQWEGSLEKFGLQVSTGPVVPFRARELLRDEIPPEAGSVPLLWMQNIKPYKAQWPLENFDKPQAISVEQKSLLVPNKNYVILRRFSAKEDRRRLIAAPFLANEYPYPEIGFENHLNIIYRGKDSLQEFDVLGLSAILNSALIDRYFRIVNGNTQVNAAELRVFPLPPLQVIQHIGRNVHDLVHLNAETVDSIVFSTLWKYHLLPEELPMIQETRIIMGKIEQAQEVLEALGLPSAQRNEISALTLLVLAQLSEDTPWQNAAEIGLRVHDILLDMKKRYGRAYAENTRETIRRQVLHQFEQAGIAIRNSDDPSLATNSPRTYYVLSELVLSALRAYGSPEWETEQTKFINQRGGLLEIYQKSREQNKVPIRVAEGTIYKLSPGKHNQLQAAVIGEFGPRFAPGARLLYLGDTARKILVLEKDKFLRLGVMIEDHGKLPDLVLYDENKNWVFMIEAVTSHGPVSPKRQFELEELFKSCAAARVYVSAFLDFATFKRFLNDIAWETEVWIAEMPSHLIHYNGDKFLGPNT